VLRVGEAGVRPRLAAVAALVDAVAPGRALAIVVLVPTQIRFASFGAMAMSPIEDVVLLSKTCSKVVPWFVVFQTPAVAVAT
jgi:hypothetical protein